MQPQKRIIRDAIRKAKAEKREHNYKWKKPVAQCHLCVNYEDRGCTDIFMDDLKRYNRKARVGTCCMGGWEVSAIDVCDSWQDDA
jgi:hypothetical protein